MKTKNLVGMFMLFLLTFTFISCDKENEEGRKITDYKEYVLTVASEMKPGVMWSDGYNYLKEVYPVKKENTEEWEALGYIDGFEFEKGYEYKIRISETSYLDHSMGQPAWTEYDLLEVLSKEKKILRIFRCILYPNGFMKDMFYLSINMPLKLIRKKQLKQI